MDSHQPPQNIHKSHEARVVLIALGDNEMMKILDSAMNQSKSVNEISKDTNITHSTCFRKIKWLLKEGLIMLDKIIITPDGKKFSLYHSTLKAISINMNILMSLWRLNQILISQRSGLTSFFHYSNIH
jgi:predicted transcriptional regulator